MTSPESDDRPSGGDPVGEPRDGSADGPARHEEARSNEAPADHDAERHPDTPATMQRDHEDAPGRQRYADARPGDYSGDFQEDDSGAHPVKPLDESAVDEDGVPEVAAREPHEGGRDAKED